MTKQNQDELLQKRQELLEQLEEVNESLLDLKHHGRIKQFNDLVEMIRKDEQLWRLMHPPLLFSEIEAIQRTNREHDYKIEIILHKEPLEDYD